MSDADVVHIMAGAMMMVLELAGPILAVCLVVGLLVSIIQTITQIQEMTLTFVPKLIGVAVVLLVGGPWMIHQITVWVQNLWATIPSL
jgi:flagellar biosynthetic protein FliQ